MSDSTTAQRLPEGSLPQQLADWFGERTALVTGAGSGMGRAIAIELARAGARVAVSYRTNSQGAAAVVEQIRSKGGRAVLLQADVADPADVQRMFGELRELAGERLDLVVNNAGQWMDKCPILECTDEQWGRMLDVNAGSVFLVCRQAAKVMVRHGTGGAIVNIGSLAGHTGGGGGTVPYAAAKAAVHTFTRGLARELAPHGIRVNGVAPGMVETDMLKERVSSEARQKLSDATPLGRFAKPEEIAPAVLFLLSPAASYITGQIIEVNGGLLMR